MKMIEKNKRYGHFLWMCSRLGLKPADLAERVRVLKPGGSIDVNGHTMKLVVLKNTPDGRLYVLDLYINDKLIRRSPCFIDPPRRGRRVRMVTEIAGMMMLVGASIAGVAIAYTFGSGLADTLMMQESCEIVRFDVFGVDENNVYYVVEAQNSGTTQKVLEMRLNADGQGWDPGGGGSEPLDEFESHVWSATHQFATAITDDSTFVVEVASPDKATLCTAGTRAK